MTVATQARDLGARGSRSALADADPAGPMSAEAAAVLAAVAGWWSARASEAGLVGRWCDVSYAVESEPPALPPVPEVEPPVAGLSGAELGALYVGGLSPSVRARHGRHYTPEVLSEHLWLMTRRGLGLGPSATRLPGLVRDLACGAGALLRPALREHVCASARTDPQVALASLPNLVHGVDADPAAVWLANVVLAAEALPLLSAVPLSRRRPFASLAVVGDGLQSQQVKARAIVMNPPYGRVKLSDEERLRWEHVLYGHANLYGLFMGAALEGLDDRGVLAALVPTSFTSGLYFSRLRATISERAPLREAAFVAQRDGVFSNVLQETCLAVFTRTKARRTSIVSVNGHATDVAQVKSPRGNGPWLLPRRADDAPTAAGAASLPSRLSDVGYRCSTGPLVWNRRAGHLGARRGADSVPVLWAADLDGGVLHRDRARDRLRFLRIDATGEPSLVLDEPAVLVQRTTSPEQARRLVAAELTPVALAAWGGRVVVENHVNVLRPTVARPLLSRQTLAAVLATVTLDRIMRCISGSVAVSAYELDSMPFPGADVLAAWDELSGSVLAGAVAAAYRTGAPA